MNNSRPCAIQNRVVHVIFDHFAQPRLRRSMRPSTVAAPATTAHGNGAAPTIGRVLAVNGSHATFGLMPQAGASDDARATVGKFLCDSQRQFAPDRLDHRRLGRSPGERPRLGFVATAKLDLMGEIMRDAARGPRFQRGVANYPVIGDGVA